MSSANHAKKHRLQRCHIPFGATKSRIASSDGTMASSRQICTFYCIRNKQKGNAQCHSQIWHNTTPRRTRFTIRSLAASEASLTIKQILLHITEKRLVLSSTKDRTNSKCSIGGYYRNTINILNVKSTDGPSITEHLMTNKQWFYSTYCDRRLHILLFFS